MIQYVPEVRSTNETLAQRLAGGKYVPEGEWLVADRQTLGRGRQGRTWFDGSGNFMGSTVVHPRFGEPPRQTLALVTALAVQAVLPLPEPHRAMLKWPNDVVVDDAKLAGILLENVDGAVIVGIGVNLALAPAVEGRRTASLAEFGVVSDRDGFAQALAKSFDTELQRWRDYGAAPVVRRWMALAHPRGSLLKVDLLGETIIGAFAGLDDDGVLQLRLADGTVRAIHAGVVSVPGAERN